MATDKTSLVRNYILSALENGELKSGEKIPGARDIATEIDISFLKVQHSLETLARDGIVEIRGRRGTYIQENWQERILHENISVFNFRDQLPWLDGLKNIMSETLPGLRFTHAFSKGMLELKPTLHVQMNHNDYLDVADIFNECFPDKSIFFEDIFKPFYIDNRLTGIPFTFSPRVIFYWPELLEKAGCKIPEHGWSWDEFMETVDKLKTVLPSDQILNLLNQPYYWLNFVMRAGGHLWDTKTNVRDSEKTRKGLKCFSSLWNKLDRFKLNGKKYQDEFFSRKSALFMAGRQFVNLLNIHDIKGWKTTTLPTIPDGENVTSQATDLLCIRKSCTNMPLAREYVKMMLSENVQDYIAQQNYAIPIRKSSAFKSIDLTNPNDSLFAVETGKLGAEQSMNHPGITRLLLTGIDRILANNIDIDSGMDELIQAASLVNKIQNYSTNK